jgi:hypothetical protein
MAQLIFCGFVEKTVFKYKPVNDLSTTKLEPNENRTAVIYSKEEIEEKEAYILKKTSLFWLRVVGGHIWHFRRTLVSRV